MTQKKYGAGAAAWWQLAQIVGPNRQLAEDLLPVVSHPDAVISPTSRMKEKGKVPSRYNDVRHVVGFHAWTDYKATPTDIERWSKEPDYGICIQTRLVRALDIDVSDPAKAEALRVFIEEHLGFVLPKRCRENSGKLLLAFEMQGTFAKRVVKVDGGMIEFLANGQQFIAVGTHPSGVPYNWTYGVPDCFPEVSAEQFEEIWSGLVAKFALEPPSTGGLRRPPGGQVLSDPTLDALDVLSWGNENQAFIRCPFEAEHTTDSGETATAYFPRGTRGYQQGHFKCLHAHCAHREDVDFLDAFGLRLKDFEDLPVVEGEPLPLPAFERHRDGWIYATLGNLRKALERPDVCGVDIRLDTFKDDVMFSPAGKGQWRAIRDYDYVALREHLEDGFTGFEPIGRELMRDAVLLIAENNKFDSAIEWINRLQWDGVPRVENFLRDYFGSEDSPYTRAVSLYMWTAMAGRVLVPGIKADMVPILVGAQGIQKSSSIAALVPAPELFVEISFAEKEDDLARRMRGRLVAEIAELRGLNSRDLEGIKTFTARTHENWVPKFKEFATNYPRRLIFIGTTNQDEFLADETGNRRWLPVRVQQGNAQRLQEEHAVLWAEARELFNILGVCHADAERLGKEIHEEYMIVDSWHDTVRRWLRTPDIDGGAPETRDFLLTSEILQGAIGIEMKHVIKNEIWRVGKILRALGYARKNIRVQGEQTKVWALK